MSKFSGKLSSGLFIKWLQEYVRLETAGYIAVGFVGIKLLIHLIAPRYMIPEWVLFVIMAIIFIWGFSLKKLPASTS